MWALAGLVGGLCGWVGAVWVPGRAGWESRWLGVVFRAGGLTWAYADGTVLFAAPDVLGLPVEHMGSGWGRLLFWSIFSAGGAVVGRGTGVMGFYRGSLG